MDKMGLVALIVGLGLCIIGGYAIWAFLPEVIVRGKRTDRNCVVLVGLMLAIFGI